MRRRLPAGRAHVYRRRLQLRRADRRRRGGPFRRAARHLRRHRAGRLGGAGARSAAATTTSFHDILAPTVPLSRHIFKAPTRFYKTGVVFLAYLNGLQDHFVMVGGQQSARSLLHLAELFRLADQARVLRDPDLAAGRMRAVLAVGGHRLSVIADGDEPRRASRSTSPPSASNGPARGGRRLPAARHHRHLPLARPGREDRPRRGRAHRPRQRPRASPASAAAACSRRPTPRAAPRAIDDNRRAIDEAAAARRRLPGAGRRRPAGRLERHRRGPRAWSPTASPRSCRTPAPPAMPLAIEPLHPMYAADRACVNTLEQALDICDALGERRRRRRSTSTTSGGIPSSPTRSPAPAQAARSSPITSATGWCRRATCSSTAA